MSDEPPRAHDADGGDDTAAVRYPHAHLVLAGRYELVSRVGRGATAQVWRARDHRLRRDVAVKAFDDRGIFDDAATRQSVEVELLAGLDHPGLVTVYDAGGGLLDAPSGSAPDAEFAYLVMDFVDGDTLAARLGDGPLPPQQVADIGRQLAQTMSYVHGRRIVHRDLKPANVLLTSGDDGPRAKITDFGIARLLDHGRLTAHGLTVGTANYLSPEQATGGDVGPPSDVYALGLVLLECLTGAPAYPGRGIEAAVARLHRAPQLPDSLEMAWRDLLVAMAAYAPGERPDMAEVAQRLAKIATSSTTTRMLPTAGGPERTADAPTVVATPAATAVLDPPRRGSRRRAALLIGAGTGVVAAATAVLVAVADGGGPTTNPGPSSAPSGSATRADVEEGGATSAGSSSSRPKLAAPSTGALSTSSARTSTSHTTRARQVATTRRNAPKGPPNPGPNAPAKQAPGKGKPKGP